MTYPINLLDLALTLYALSLGCAELNPLMRSVPVMVAYKVITVGGLCWVLGRVADIYDGHKTGRMARLGLNLCTVIYGGLCIYHLYGLLMIGGM